MQIDKEKLVQLISRGHKLNAIFMEPALLVAKELDQAPEEDDFDITEIETKALGPLLSIESARIAKIIGQTHKRGVEWIDKFNRRVRSRSAQEESEINNAIQRLRSNKKVKEKPKSEKEQLAEKLVNEAMERIQKQTI